MLEWQRAGYFRSGLLLRREVDNIFSNLATYTQLYGRSVLCCTVLYSLQTLRHDFFSE